jgi:aspartate/methionine/tyrosine aminotransferase
MGALSARKAVAQYYDDHGVELDREHLLLTTSTSEAYGWLFKLLCDGGDEVLIAQPSYPLFQYLAELEELKLNTYPLFYDFGWWIDFAELERKIGPSTRAIVVVHPNNPTGHATGKKERQLLEDLCAQRSLALIVDEVFLDYPWDAETAIESFAAGPHPVLTFVLSGMSKIAGLPQMKAAWVATFGPDPERVEALSRLEVIGDTYLSMNAPVQAALPSWIAGRSEIQGQIRKRIQKNLVALKTSGIGVLQADGGWSAVLQVPRTWGGGTLFRRLLELGVVVHPGELFGMAGENRVVVSLIAPEEIFREAAGRIATLSS